MRRIGLMLITALLTTPLAAQQDAANGDNTADKQQAPDYESMAPAELRRRIGDIDEVWKTDWYQVEVLIFARKNPVSDEYWRLGRDPEMPDNVIRLANDEREKPELPEPAGELDRTAAEEGAWQPLADKEHQIKAMANRMLRRGGYRILFHESWRQPVRKENRAFPIYVSGGDKLTPPKDTDPMRGTRPAPEFDDKVDTPREQEQKQESGAEETPSFSDKPEEGNAANPQRANTTQKKLSEKEPESFPEMRGTLLLHVSRYLHIDPNLWFTDKDAKGRFYHVRIDRSRRMRSEELHYLDHPKFGLLIHTKPWKSEPQKTLEKMKEALEAQMKRDEQNAERRKHKKSYRGERYQVITITAHS